MISYFPGGALGPLILASAYDTWGSYEGALLGFLALVALAPLALLCLPRAPAEPPPA